MEGVFEPRAEHIVQFLDGKKGQHFRTSDLRMKLSTYSYNTPTEPINGMLIDLSKEGYVEPVEYDGFNHEWQVVDGNPDVDDIESVLTTYLEAPVNPNKFYSAAE